MEKILRYQKHPRDKGCGCTGAIQQLKYGNKKSMIPFMLFTEHGELLLEWGRSYHRSFATVFYAVIKVNCRYQEAGLELLRPNVSIVDPRTGRLDRRRLRDVDYVVPSGERVLVDTARLSRVKTLPEDFIRYTR